MRVTCSVVSGLTLVLLTFGARTFTHGDSAISLSPTAARNTSLAYFSTSRTVEGANFLGSLEQQFAHGIFFIAMQGSAICLEPRSRPRHVDLRIPELLQMRSEMELRPFQRVHRVDQPLQLLIAGERIKVYFEHSREGHIGVKSSGWLNQHVPARASLWMLLDAELELRWAGPAKARCRIDASLRLEEERNETDRNKAARRVPITAGATGLIR